MYWDILYKNLSNNKSQRHHLGNLGNVFPHAPRLEKPSEPSDLYPAKRNLWKGLKIRLQKNYLQNLSESKTVCVEERVRIKPMFSI